MSLRSRVLMLAVAVVGGVACGRPVEATSHPIRDTVTTSIPKHTAEPEAVPMVLETGAPLRPPPVALVVHSGARDVVVPGKLYTGDWPTDTAPLRVPPVYPVPWPTPTTIHGGDDPTIALGTRFMPDFVVVKIYAEIDRASLVPIGYPIASFACDRFTQPQCRTAMTAQGIRIVGLDQTTYAGTYVMVYAQWHQPSKPRVHTAYPTGPGDLAAAWMFRIAHTRAAGSLP
jgi:hypothetical protein